MKNICLYAIITALLTLSCISYYAGSSEHDNAKILGRVVTPDGYPVNNVRVWLMNSDYNHCASSSASYRVTATDQHGYFEFDSLPAGDYSVSGRLYSQPRGFVKRSIIIDSSTVVNDEYTLSNTATIIIDRDTFNLDSTMYIILPGLPICQKLDKQQTKIEFVPPGVLRIRAYDPLHNKEIILSNDLERITINPGDILMLSSKSPEFANANVDSFKNFYGIVNTPYFFSLVKRVGSSEQKYQYQFSWGDGTALERISEPEAWHSWKDPGIYPVRAQLRSGDTLFDWSDPLFAVIKENSPR
ncbi:MAG: hypothetical protein GX640_11755 [Fibrobacter sp.]|nr:hypothetical protein [Fibrobacter sp.]